MQMTINHKSKAEPNRTYGRLFLGGAITLAAIQLLCSGCADKLDQYSPIRLTNDKAIELAASFLGEEEVCYTSHIQGSAPPRIIHIIPTSGDQKGKTAIEHFETIPRYFNILQNGIYGLDGQIAVLANFYDDKFQDTHGIFIVNSDGSPIDKGDYKVAFESTDYVNVEGYLDGKLYITTWPGGVRSDKSVCEVSLEGKVTEIDKFARDKEEMIIEAIKDRQEIMDDLRTDFYRELGSRVAVHDFKTDKDNKITHVLFGYIGKDGQWDLYVSPYQGDLKCRPTEPGKSSSLDTRTNELFAQRQYNELQSSQCEAYKHRMNSRAKTGYQRRIQSRKTDYLHGHAKLKQFLS